MSFLARTRALIRALGGSGRELRARLAYAVERRRDLVFGPDVPDAGAIAAIDTQLTAARADLDHGRFARVSSRLNDLEERLAALEGTANEAAGLRQAEVERIRRLDLRIDDARRQLVVLRRAGIGTDGLAMLEAGLVRAEQAFIKARASDVQAVGESTDLARAEAEIVAVEGAIVRLTKRARH